MRFTLNTIAICPDKHPLFELYHISIDNIYLSSIQPLSQEHQVTDVSTNKPSMAATIHAVTPHV